MSVFFSIKLTDSPDLDCESRQTETIITTVLTFGICICYTLFFEILVSLDCLFNIKRKSLKIDY